LVHWGTIPWFFFSFSIVDSGVPIFRQISEREKPFRAIRKSVVDYFVQVCSLWWINTKASPLYFID
jgi:hypothetical protein